MATLKLPKGDPVVLSAVGFDIDGTVRDTGYPSYEALCKTVEELGGQVPTYPRFVADYHPAGGFYPTCGVEAHPNRVLEVFRKHQTQTMPGPYNDVEILLAYLDALRSIPVFLINTSRGHNVEGWLMQYGLISYVAYFSCEIKNKRSCLTQACASAGVSPAQVVWVEDLGYDMRDARAVGAVPVGITRGYESRAALMASGAEVVVHDLIELRDLID